MGEIKCNLNPTPPQPSSILPPPLSFPAATTEAVTFYLQHLVWGRLDAGDHMGGTECDLFHLGKVVCRVSVKDHFTDRDERVLLLGPHLWSQREKYMNF